MSEPKKTKRVLKAGKVVFSRHVLEAELGRGGMGVVWRARDTLLDRNVALKFLPAESAGEEERLHELQNETRRCLSLTHPNIVRVYDFAYKGAYAAIVMELIDGKTLGQHKLEQANRCLQPSEIRKWIGPVIDALEYAHNRMGIVHRDLKPSNLLMDRCGVVRIADFGVARKIQGPNEQSKGEGRTAAGTMLYMGPQQLGGELPSASDDIYSLGATIYELLTGFPPFYKGDIQSQIKSVEATSVRQRKEGLVGEKVAKLMEPIPLLWDEVVCACLKKDSCLRPSLTLLKRVLSAGDFELNNFDRNDQIHVWRAALAEEAYDAALLSEKDGSINDRYTALTNYTKAAELGHVDAQEELARAYGRGDGVTQDLAKAAFWFSRAAENGTPADKYLLAARFEDGDGVERDLRLAVMWYLKAAECGDKDAQFAVAIAYRYGDGVAQNDYLAVEWYRKAALQGHALSQRILGDAYESGKGVVPDASKAIYWYRQAAEQGNACAQNALGSAYSEGAGVEQDFPLAHSWWKKAASQNNTSAQINIGNAFRFGKGVGVDFGSAVLWYRKAADLDDALACYFLGGMCEAGQGVPVDKVAALVWYRKAADLGLDCAQLCLAKACEEGDGTPKDIEMALHWYEAAARQGHPHAQYKMGVFLEQGIETEKDSIAAFGYYLKSAEQNYGPAMTKAAECYANGLGVKENTLLANNWRQQAEANDLNKLQENIKRIEQTLKAQEEAEAAQSRDATGVIRP